MLSDSQKQYDCAMHIICAHPFNGSLSLGDYLCVSCSTEVIPNLVTSYFSFVDLLCSIPMSTLNIPTRLFHLLSNMKHQYSVESVNLLYFIHSIADLMLPCYRIVLCLW
jgi:hypothetical protein